MHFWHASREATRIHGLRTRDRGQPGKNRGNSEHEACQAAPRRPKINRLSCSTQSVYLQIGRESPTSLPADEKIAKFCLDGRSSNGFRGTQKATANSASPGSTPGKRAALVVYCCHKPSCQRSHSGGEGRRRKITESTEASVLHLRSPHTIQTEIPSLPEDNNGDLLGVSEARTLLPGSFPHRGLCRSPDRPRP